MFVYNFFAGLNLVEGTMKGALMSNHCLISHRWYNVEKLPVLAVIVKDTAQSLVLKRWKKNLLHFVFLT